MEDEDSIEESNDSANAKGYKHHKVEGIGKHISSLDVSMRSSSSKGGTILIVSLPRQVGHHRLPASCSSGSSQSTSISSKTTSAKYGTKEDGSISDSMRSNDNKMVEVSIGRRQSRRLRRKKRGTQMREA